VSGVITPTPLMVMPFAVLRTPAVRALRFHLEYQDQRRQTHVKPILRDDPYGMNYAGDVAEDR
jgi:hypothetical protein